MKLSLIYLIYKSLNEWLAFLPLVGEVDQCYSSERKYFRKACDNGLILISLMGSWFEGPTLRALKKDLSFGYYIA